MPKLFLLFEPIQIQETVSDVLITFGGADPNNYTEQVLEFITKPEYSDVHFYIVLGKAKQNVDKILQYNQYENIVDNCTLFMLLNKKVHLVEGNFGNIKITTPEDIYILKGILEYLSKTS